MDWPIALAVIIGSLVVMMAVGMPVAIAFLAVNTVFLFIWWGGEAGLGQLILSMYQSVTRFSFLPVPLFVLMGEVMLHSGIAPKMINAIDEWMGRFPGRLGLVAVSSGTLFSTLSGSSMASVAMLGSALTPEMEKRGYKKSMSLGPILGSGGLAQMIPPASLAVIFGSIANVSVGHTLIAIIIPGLLMAALYATYIAVRCQIQPSIAPAYAVVLPSVRKRLVTTAKYILPVGLIVFLVTGVILLGIATPTEAAATGSLGTFILVALYGRLNWEMVKTSLIQTLEISAMVLLIISGAEAFSQNLAFTGASRGLAEFIMNLPVSPPTIVIAMMVVIVFLGMFMSPVPIMMITLPIFVPVLITMGFSVIWFGVMFLIAIEMGTTSPPFGLSLFVMKGVAPPGTTMGDCYKAALPFLGCDLIAMMLVFAFPAIALWLPGVML